MAIYHCSIKNISRGSGKSAVASASYRAGEKLEDLETGLIHDYTRKKEIAYSEIFLCKNAPKEYQDRGTLWNAVEQIEKQSKARLAREWEVALPNELTLEQSKELVKGFAQSLVDEGMCVDVNIHWKEGNHHAHIMATVRAINEKGQWAPKTKKVYCRDVYGEKIPLIDKSTGLQKVDKQNRKQWKCYKDDYTDWNKREKVEEWRSRWAEHCNMALEKAQSIARVDHRSYAAQGIEELPTIHEGYIAQNMEKKGMIADRCEINRQIRADNKMLRELKANVAKLAEAVEKSIPIIAETLEAIRNHMIFTQYHLLHNEMQKEVIHDWMNHFNPILNKYNTVKKKLKAKVTERKELNVKKEKTSILNPIQHIKLNQQLTTVTEEIEELKSRKEQLIFQTQCSTDKDMTNLSKKYDQMNNNLDILDSQDISLKKQLEKDAAAFREEKFRPEPEQYTELLDTRIQIRPDFRDKLIEQLKGTFGKYYDYHRRDIATNEVDYLNVEDPDVFSHRAWELEYQRKQEMRRNQPIRSKKRSYDMEL